MMQHLSSNPAEAYRRVDLDARIAASGGADLTRICLEEAASALGHALHALSRDPKRAPRERLVRAHGILTWLAANVAPDNPLRDQLRQLYGAIAGLVSRNMIEPSPDELAQAHGDLIDLLAAASGEAEG
ncbi:MAG: hypothetical protein WA936_00140 [Erythrobacter sp.]